MLLRIECLVERFKALLDFFQSVFNFPRFWVSYLKKLYCLLAAFLVCMPEASLPYLQPHNNVVLEI